VSLRRSRRAPGALLWLALAALTAPTCWTTAKRTANVEADVADTARLRQLREAVARQVGGLRCSEQSQCRFLPIGSKPCGGPWSYLLYSKVTTDSAALAVAVERYNAAEAELNRKLGRVSDCGFVSPPKLDCVEGVCTRASGAPGPR